MTENDIMEELSKKYVEVLANMAGYFIQYGRDYGTDMLVRKAPQSNHRARHLTSGKAIDIQLKAVHKRYVPVRANLISYSMEVKNYNDLVERKQENGAYIPLYLIVFIVPNRIDDWIEHSIDELKIRECAYYYEIDDAATLSKNVAKHTIYIPVTNIVDAKLFDTLFSQLN